MGAIESSIDNTTKYYVEVFCKRQEDRTMFVRHNEEKKNNVGRISRTFRAHNGSEQTVSASGVYRRKRYPRRRTRVLIRIQK